MVGKSIDVVNKQNDVGFKLSRKTGMMALRADVSGDENITFEGVKLLYTFMDVEKEEEEEEEKVKEEEEVEEEEDHHEGGSNDEEEE